MFASIRPYGVSDTISLTTLYNHFHSPVTPTDLHRQFSLLQRGNGRVWVSTVAEQVVGYATMMPVPGLPNVVDVDGAITLAWQRRGLGGQLLRQMVADLRSTTIDQLSHCLSDLHIAAAHFLRKYHFYEAHEEQQLRLTDVTQLPPYQLPATLKLMRWPRTTAVAMFCRLYDAAFSPHPWYQPYGVAEVSSSLQHAHDLLFLYAEHQPIGVAWLHLEGVVGCIEPIGLRPQWQGRGYGRLLLLAGLHELVRRGATAVDIGVWRTNIPAMTLYQQIGFEWRQTFWYWAYDL